MLHRLARIALLMAGISASALGQTGPIPAPIPHGPITIGLQPVASGLTAPVGLVQSPDNTGRKFIVDQVGKVRIVDSGGNLLATPFMDVATTGDFITFRSGYDERGLLGFTFDPNFNNSLSVGFGRVFTWESNIIKPNPDYPLTTAGTVDHQDALVSWKVSTGNPNVIDPTSRNVMLRIDHPSFNHDAGEIAFGPDGYLYFGDGDGGGSNDTGNGHNASIGNAQDVNSPLGKIHRIDVYGSDSANGKYGIPSDNPFAASGGVKEIFAHGFRNPFKFNFDGPRLLVADVGQNNIEEIDHVAKGNNYGWNYKEGTFAFNKTNGTVSTDLTGIPAGLIDPLAQYDHDEGIAIVGGYVYHGSKMPFLEGMYVFGDFSKSFSTPSGRLFYADLNTGSIREFALANGDLPLGMFVKGMGRDLNGELYLLASTTLAPTGTTGVALQIIPEPSALGLVGASLLLGSIRRRRRSGTCS